MLAAFGLCLMGPGASAAVRTWTNTLNRTWQGEFLRMDGPSAVFMVDGKEYSYPLAGMSADDKVLIFQLRRPPPPASSPTPFPTPAALNNTEQTAAQASADAAFDAYNAAFLLRKGGQTYYRKSTTSEDSNGTWVLATQIQLAEDAYDRTHTAKNRQLVTDLINTFLVKAGRDWSYTTWNDDIGWMMITCIRGYQITKDMNLLKIAENQWHMAYDRGWDDTFGGGIWEDNKPKFSKCALSNDPFVTTGCSLYQITHDASYLKRSKEIYAWVRANLVDHATGQVNEGIARTGLQASDNVYNAGAFIAAANSLYNVTGEEGYLRDAQLTADHVVRKQPILSHNARGENCWSDQFARGLGDFCRDRNLWGRYRSWITANARSAWTYRRPDLNVTWNDWKSPTPTDDCSSFECLGAAVLQQVILPGS